MPDEKNYSKMRCEELRQLILNGELEQGQMSLEDYERLFDNESERGELGVSQTVIDFCVLGLRMLGKYSWEEYIEINMLLLTKRIKRNIPYEKLRNGILSGGMEYSNFDQFTYEYLLQEEADAYGEVTDVMLFCAAGLKRYDKYHDYYEAEIYCQAIYRSNAKKLAQKAGEDAEQSAEECITPPGIWERKTSQTSKAFNKKITIKRYAVVSLIAIVSVFFVATAVANFMGHNIADLIEKALNMSEKNIMNYDENDVTHTSDFRVYNSIYEMLKAENLDILYPTGYNFNDFVVANRGTHLEIRAYAEEPYISFYVEVGTSQISPNSYSYETNGIEYNISKTKDELYQAWWFSDDDYYTITVIDKAIIAEIINNLEEY